MPKQKNVPLEISLNPCQIQGNRGKRTPRLAMFARLFVIVWGAILCGVNFLAILGMTVGVGVALIGTLGGVGLIVLVGWFIVNSFADITHRHDPNYRTFRKSGGDPYFDRTWFWPLNMDSDEIRNTGGTLTNASGQQSVFAPTPATHEIVNCLECGHAFYLPMDEFFVRGADCPSCGKYIQSTNQIDRQFTARLAELQNPRIFEG